MVLVSWKGKAGSVGLRHVIRHRRQDGSAMRRVGRETRSELGSLARGPGRDDFFSLVKGTPISNTVWNEQISIRRVMSVLDDDEICSELLGASRYFQGKVDPWAQAIALCLGEIL